MRGRIQKCIGEPHQQRYFNFTGTRLRAPEKLRANLHYQNALSEADDDGFNFPSTTSADLQAAIAALPREEEVEEELFTGSATTADLQEALVALSRINGEEEEVEEEVIGWDWEELDED